MTGVASLSAIREYIPGLLQYRYTVANLHRPQHGVGAPVPIEHMHAARIRIDDDQLDHFMNFIASPHIVQDLPFGQKYLHLSNGNVLEVPNVIRAVIPERIFPSMNSTAKKLVLIPSAHEQCSGYCLRAAQRCERASRDWTILQPMVLQHLMT